MTPEERAGIARAVADAIADARAEILRECDQRLATEREAHTQQLVEIRRSAESAVVALRDDLADTRHRLELADQALGVLRSDAEDDPLAAAVLDGDGVLHLVQRNGGRLAVRLPDVATLLREGVAAMRAEVRAELAAEANAAVARCFELFLNAPAWSPAAVYTEGQVVQHHVGRTYRVRAGVKATTGKEPGEHAEHWERLGTGGLRVLKSRPEALQPGDVFTEHDARFLHDGSATILFVPAAAKKSDIERAVKGPHGLAQALQSQVTDLAARITDLAAEIRRSSAAANDGAANGAQALGEVEQLREELEQVRRQLAGGST